MDGWFFPTMLSMWISSCGKRNDRRCIDRTAEAASRLQSLGSNLIARELLGRARNPLNFLLGVYVDAGHGAPSTARLRS